jgi:signal peptidase I
VLLITALAFGAWFINASLSFYRVGSASMEPALHCAAGTGCTRLRADVVLVGRLIPGITEIERGDIAAFRLRHASRRACRSDSVILKRVVGVPGDVMDGQYGALYVDRSRSASKPPAKMGSRGAPYVIARDHFFVMSDNPRGSCDSREVGPIPKAAVLGKVILVYSPRWSLHRPRKHGRPQ